jgi:hypothetical protein
MPKKFSALNNSTIHTIALRTQHSAPDLRFTLHASRFTHHESRPFSKIANFAVKSVKSRITNHAPDGYQMTTEVVII